MGPRGIAGEAEGALVGSTRFNRAIAAALLRPLRVGPASDDGAEFLDQAAAAPGSLGRIAKFEGEAGHGTEIWGRIALIKVIEQSGANIVYGTDVDPCLSVRQAIDASPRRGVLPY